MLLQFPDILAAGAVLWVLQAWSIVSTGWALSLFILWVAKDLALYPLVRGALVPRGTESDPLVGARGVAQEALAPRGQVRIGSEIWQAETRRPGGTIAPGTPVTVRATRGLTLIVEPEDEPLPRAGSVRGSGARDEGANGRGTPEAPGPRTW
jgi:membrane protein implicated in regulation of membrane protease activity